jgi:rSAM/selenodomain-associated transferase 2
MRTSDIRTPYGSPNERCFAMHSASPPGGKGRISVIVPVLDEAAGIREFLAHVRNRAPGAEIIVVDGGSADGTARLAADGCDRLLTSPRGRARQMNAGADVACGEVLWFLHADSQLPHSCLDEILRALADPRTIGGCFRIRFPRPEPIYRLNDALGNLGVVVLRCGYGDHGIFCLRDAFIAAGRYPDVPIMEDGDLYRALSRRGRMRLLAGQIVTSPRRYERVGPWRLTGAFALIAALWYLRVPHRDLARIYRRFCTHADAPNTETMSTATTARPR